MEANWQLPGYDVQQSLRHNELGRVWRGRDLRSGDRVALLRVQPAEVSGRDRLRREAAVLSSVVGGHIVRVRDVVATPDALVVVSDDVAGVDLAEVLRGRGRLTAPEVVTVVGPVAAALADAHDRGLVHGGVSTGCIVFADDGRPLLADFGVARALSLNVGEDPSAASDVYALSAVATAALGGGPAPAALVAAIRSGLADDPHDRPTARELSLAVLRSCAAAPVRLPPVVDPDPDARAAAPTAAATDVATTPVPPPTARPPRQRRPRRGFSLASGAAAALVLAALAGVAWGRHAGAVGTVLQPRVATSTPPAPTLPGPTPPSTASDWFAVVTRLAASRTLALSTADARLLAGVYQPGSTALARDTATIRRLVREGERPRGLRVTPVAVRVVLATARRAVLLVTDTASGYVLVDGDGRIVRSVPARTRRTWTMTLVRRGGHWLVADVSR